jgi:hypothetical protein
MEWSTIRAIFTFDNCIFPEATIYIADNATDESIAFVQQHYLPLKS